MPNAIALGSDFDATTLRRLARRSKEAFQARRLPALAAIYDGGTRSEAARLGNVTLQIVRDRVVRFNAEGPDGLRDRKAPDPAGPALRLHLHLRCRLPAREGKGVALVLPFCNSAAMSLHLAEISAMVASGRHAVLLLDQAGWHLSDQVAVPANITLLPLPPKCPELNGMENVWQFMRENWLSNRVFRDHDTIVALCCHAWNRLIDQPCRTTSIGLRDWAHRS